MERNGSLKRNIGRLRAYLLDRSKACIGVDSRNFNTKEKSLIKFLWFLVGMDIIVIELNREVVGKETDILVKEV